MASKSQPLSKSRHGNNAQRDTDTRPTPGSGTYVGHRRPAKSTAPPRQRNPEKPKKEPSAEELTLRAWKHTYAKRDRFREVL